MISEILDIINHERLSVTVNSDEIIFYLWETEVPLAFDKKTKTVALKPCYHDGFKDSFKGYDSDTMNKIVQVTSIIQSYADDMLREW